MLTPEVGLMSKIVNADIVGAFEFSFEIMKNFEFLRYVKATEWT